MRRLRPVLAVAVIAAVVMGAASRRSRASAESAPLVAEVKIDNFTFEPQELIVKAGTKITWTNRDDIPHTVVSSDLIFKSKTLDTDDTFSFTPAKPGTYEYFCSIHPKMTGKILVH